MKRMFFSLLAAIIIGAGCADAGPSKPVAAQREAEAPRYAEAERIPAEAAPAPVPQPPDGAQKFRDGSVRVTGKAIAVTDAAGKVIASNDGIIHLRDEEGDCPSNGFGRVAVKGDYFTIEQQRCGGMFFIDEYVTFKAGRDGKIWLYKFSIVKTDRENPDKVIPQRNLGPKEFGQIELRDVELQKLYQLF